MATGAGVLVNGVLRGGPAGPGGPGAPGGAGALIASGGDTDTTGATAKELGGRDPRGVKGGVETGVCTDDLGDFLG
jgi:hypothetical protein